MYVSTGCAAPENYLWVLARTYDLQPDPADSLLPVPIEDIMTPNGFAIESSGLPQPATNERD